MCVQVLVASNILWLIAGIACIACAIDIRFFGSVVYPGIHKVYEKHSPVHMNCVHTYIHCDDCVLFWVACGTVYRRRFGAVHLRHIRNRCRVRRAPELQNTVLLLLYIIYVRKPTFGDLLFVLTVTLYYSMPIHRCFAVAFFVVGTYFLADPIQQEISKYELLR